MPCYDPQNYRNDPELKNQVDKLTRMLCRVCRNIEEISCQDDELLHCDGELSAWWQDHQIIDENRRIQIKVDALKKLTKEEQEVLRDAGLIL
jgi:hypothetical protein